MIWYLLYPYRGTTEAPTLHVNHPLRKALTLYAENVARHVTTTLVMAITLVTLVVLPFPFLYTVDGYNGTSVLPGTNWKSVRMIEDATQVSPDAVVRSMWTYTVFGEALLHDSLRKALPLHNLFLGLSKGCDIHIQGNTSPKTCTESGQVNLTHGIDNSVFNVNVSSPTVFHSPIKYWNCSMDSYHNDQNLRRTILHQAFWYPQVVNMVFASPKFRGRRLRSVDALVSTVIHTPGAEIGSRWNDAMSALIDSTLNEWVSSPTGYSSQESDMFEFQKTPMSTVDVALLWLAYTLTVLYFSVSFIRLKAVRSRTGLVITIALQTVLSMLSSLTICSALEIDVSHIPRAIYPLAVVALTLENIFRLINSVLLTPGEARPSKRVGYAFGDSAPTVMMSFAHNMIALWISSQIFSPAVAALCKFIAFAMIFDVIYFSTFFLAVLSVDLRRLELSESLANKTAYRPSKPISIEIKLPVQWPDSMMTDRIALSTRTVAMIVMLNLFVWVQYHLPGFGFWNVRRLRLMNAMVSNSDLAVSISWVRMARWEDMPEAFSVIDPSLTRFVVQVMQPISFVPRECIRIRPVFQWPFSNIFWDFVDRHLAAFFVSVIVIVGFVRLLLNFLLQGESMGVSEEEEQGREKDELYIRTYPADHGLDVTMMSSAPDGKIVSVGLDRTIRVWDARGTGPSRGVGTREQSRQDLFPVLALAIDHESKWLAILGRRKVMIWSLEKECWDSIIEVALSSSRLLKFFFDTGPAERIPPAIAVQADGSLVEMWTDVGQTVGGVVSSSPLVSVDILRGLDTDVKAHGGSIMILAASQVGTVFCAAKDTNSQWQSKQVSLDSEDGPVHQVVVLTDIKSALAVRSRSVDLIDLASQTSVHTFATGSIRYRTLQCSHFPHFRQPCGGIGINSLALVYTCSESSDCVMQTYLPSKASDSMCFQCSRAHKLNPDTRATPGCCLWTEAVETTKHVSNPGSWQALSCGSIIGVRRRYGRSEYEVVDKGCPSSARSPSTKIPESLSNNIRRRPGRLDHRAAENPGVKLSLGVRGQNENQGSRIWEAWMVTDLGRREFYETRPLHVEERDGEWLVINELGPVVRVGASVVAVGFGNIVKVVSAGDITFDENREDKSVIRYRRPVRQKGHIERS